MLAVILIYLVISAFITCIIVAACVVSGRSRQLRTSDRSPYSTPSLRMMKRIVGVQF